MNIAILFNHQPFECEGGLSLAQLLLQQGYCDGCFAVALNQHFIPKSHYLTTEIKPHDQIEIITAMQGG